MNTRQKTAFVICAVASLAVLPVYVQDDSTLAVALPSETLPPAEPEPTQPVPVVPTVEPEPVPSEDTPVDPVDPVDPEIPLPTPTETPAPPDQSAPPAEPVPVPSENPVPPADPEPLPPAEPEPTPPAEPPAEPVPAPSVDPLPPANPAPLPSSGPAQPQPANSAPANSRLPAPVGDQAPALPPTQEQPVADQALTAPYRATTEVPTPAPGLQAPGNQPSEPVDSPVREDRTPAGSSMLGLANAPQQNYSGAPDWVEGFLNANGQSNLGDTSNNSNQAAGVMGAEAQGHQLEPTGGSNVFQRGMSIVTGARPLLIFSGLAVTGLALVIFNFVWRNRAPKA